MTGRPFDDRLDEEVRLLVALIKEQYALGVEIETVRMFGTPENPKVFVGLQEFLDGVEGCTD